MQEDYEDNYIEDSAPVEREEAPAAAEARHEPDYEAEARKQGWKPQDEFDGPKEKWRPAKEFVDRGNEDPRILRSRVDKLDKLYEGVKRERENERKELERAFNERIERQERMARVALQRQRESYEQQIAAAKREAVSLGDTERYAQIENHEQHIRQQWAEDDKQLTKTEERPAPAQQQANEPTPEVKAWLGRNSWFNKDQALTEVATAYEDYLAKARPGLTLEERLEETRKHVVKEFPHKFGRKAAMNGDGRSGSPVEGSQRTAGQEGGSDGGFSELPAEARQQFKDFVKEKLFKDDAAGRREYAKYYFEPNSDKAKVR